VLGNDTQSIAFAHRPRYYNPFVSVFQGGKLGFFGKKEKFTDFFSDIPCSVSDFQILS